MIIPIGDENPTQRIPYVNYLIIGLNILILVLFNFRSDFGRIVQSYGFTPAHPQLLTSFTSMFMHAGILHIVGNMLFLYIFGDNVEDVLGYWYIGFYLVCGLAADLLHYLVDPASAIPAVGASGAISGVLGFYLIFFPWHRVRFWYWMFYYFAGTFYLEAFWAIGFWFILQLFYGLILLAVPGLGGVAYWAHIGGFICGAAIALPIKMRYSRQINEVVDEKAGVLRDVVISKRQFNPDQLLSEPLNAGRQSDYVRLYNNFKTSYGEARISFEHHLKAAEILMDRAAYSHAVDIFYSLLLLYPTHPMAPKIKYYLGMMLTHKLNQPKKGLKYFKQLADQPDFATEAQQELDKIESNIKDLSPQKTIRQLKGKCMVMRRGNGAIDSKKIGKLVAEITGKNPYDVIAQISYSAHIIARDVDARQAVILADYLQHQGIKSAILDEAQCLTLPEAQLILRVRFEDSGLHLESAVSSNFLGWDDIYLALSGRLTGKEQVLERRKPGHTGIGRMLKRKHVPIAGIPFPMSADDGDLTYVNKDTNIFEINIVHKDLTGLFRLNSNSTTVSNLPNAPQYQTKSKGLSLLAQELLKRLNCPHSRPGLELLALERFKEPDWQKFSFHSLFYFNAHTNAVLNLKKAGIAPG